MQCLLDCGKGLSFYGKRVLLSQQQQQQQQGELLPAAVLGAVLLYRVAGAGSIYCAKWKRGRTIGGDDDGVSQ